MINTIVFDLDDTLYYEIDYVFGAFKEVSKHLSSKYKIDETIILSVMKKILKENGRGKVFDATLEKFNINERVDNLINIYRNSIPKISMFSESIEVLKELKRRGFNLGIITDGNSIVQHNKIKALGLLKYVDKIIVTDDYGKEFWKPNTRAYKDIMTFFNVNGEECVYVGDNPNKDFYAPNKLSWVSIMIDKIHADYVNREYIKEDYIPKLKVSSLKEILEYIEEVNCNESNLHCTS